MNYETWRATFQSSEQAARTAYREMQSARAVQDGAATDVGCGWTSVGDQLPDADLQVLVYVPLVDEVDFDYLDVCADSGGEWFANDPGRLITHWTPVPTPPAQNSSHE